MGGSWAGLFTDAGAAQTPAPADIVIFRTEASPTPTAVGSPLPLLGAPLVPITPTPALETAPSLDVPPAERPPLEVLSHQIHIDSLGRSHIIGEVKNNSEAPLEFVEVIARLYDAANNEIGTLLTFTDPDLIFPNSTAPFDLIILRREQRQKLDKYDLQVKGYDSKVIPSQNLVILNQRSRLEDDLLYVQGEVKNTGRQATLVKLVVTLYDANYRVINTQWGYADLGIIPANQTSSFELKLDHYTDPNNYHYRIQIEEDIIDSPDDIPFTPTPDAPGGN